MTAHPSFRLFTALLPIIALLSPGLSGGAAAQEKFSISGTVKNAENGEALIGANVVVRELKNTGASTNAYGFYSLTIPGGRYTLIVQYLGFKVLADSIDLRHDRTFNVALTPEPISIGEVVVSGERSDKNVTSTVMSSNKLEMREVKSIPVLLGEKDILKTIQLLPGVQGAGEGNTGFYARGGGLDQNLILLDEAPIYNPSHALGYLSVFNSDAIKDVTMITGGIPAEYGGRLSSVLDIRTNDGNMKEYGVSGGIGLLTSRITVQGPIVKDEGSFMVSARSTYADLFLRFSTDTTINRTSLYFYDLNAKANYTLGEKDRIYLSGYLGSDNLDYPDVIGLRWGNATATARWNHIFGDQFFSNTTLTFSDYTYTNLVGSSTSQYQITSGIKDVNGKIDLQYFMNATSMLKFGVNVIYHTFAPGAVTAGPTSSANSVSLEHRYALENAAYVAHEVEPSPGLKVNYGLRASMFNLMGPGHTMTYDEYGDIVDTAGYGPGQVIKTYASLEPRVSATYLLDDESSVKGSYTRTAQYLHLLSNSTTSNPSDLWVPSSNNVRPQYADQVALGYYKNFAENEYESSLELYYKNMTDLIDYKNGADLQINPTVESLLVFGRGWSYGAEFLIRKRAGRFSGWVGYTWSKTLEQFPLVNNGAVFPARQDRRHDISIVTIYDLNPLWNISAVWVYNTGNAVTFPAGNYWIDNRLVPYYTERNGYRMPAYHRLDLSSTWKLGEHSNLNVSIYNLYNRMNAYAIYFRQNRTDPTKTEAVQITLFPVMPSVTYNFSF
ncbi:MAG TPA: TonB-dependent receptor [Bacteroidota bacterium]|nr:TonB-dependent receptor [Bacteroidota bacterium]